MSDGMTDKRSQRDEDKMGAPREWTEADERAAIQAIMKRDRDDLYAWAKRSAEQVNGRQAVDPEAAAELRRGMARRDEFEIRHAALDLAVRTNVSAVYALEVAATFLAFLRGDMTEFCKAAEPAAAPDAPEKTPAEMADVGDVVEIHAPVAAIDPMALKSRVSVFGKFGGSIWVSSDDIKRIVRKASEKMT